MKETYKDMEINFNWFLENYKKLYETYGSCYIVIYKQEVIGKFKSVREALDHITLKPGTYNIQYIDSTETAYTSYIDEEDDYNTETSSESKNNDFINPFKEKLDFDDPLIDVYDRFSIWEYETAEIFGKDRPYNTISK